MGNRLVIVTGGRRRIGRAAPMQRVGTATDTAVVRLLSGQTSAITSAIIDVSGGR